MASFPAAVRSSRKLAFTLNNQARHVSDLAISRTGKPILRIQGGRYVVQVFAPPPT